MKARLFALFLLMLALFSSVALSENFDDVFPPDSLQRRLAEKIVSDTGLKMIDYGTWHNHKETARRIKFLFNGDIEVTLYYNGDWEFESLDVYLPRCFADDSAASSNYLNIVRSIISYFVPDNPLVDVPSRILNRLENSLDVNDVYRNKQGQSSDKWLENGYHFQLSLSVVSSEIWTYFDVEPVLSENP